MNTQTFEGYRKLIKQHAGICLAPGKEALITSRIAKRIRELSLENEMDYLRYVQAEDSVEELTHLIDLMSTNVTSFLREEKHFEILRDRLNRTWTGGLRPMRFWSAACSTGQEPYTLAMIVDQCAQEFGASPQLVKILATDISSRVLAKAAEGIYTPSELESLPDTWIDKYFLRHGTNGNFQLRDSIRTMVSFRRLNLSRTPYPMQGPFDAILCRNVMIYFDVEIRSRIVKESQRLLCNEGLFLVGHSESLSGIDHSLRTSEPTVYVKGD